MCLRYSDPTQENSSDGIPLNYPTHFELLFPEEPITTPLVSIQRVHLQNCSVRQDLYSLHNYSMITSALVSYSYSDMLSAILVLSTTVFLIFITLFLALPSRYGRVSLPHPKVNNDNIHLDEISVQIIVVGDIGRSPRMQYHALSIAKHGGRVDIIGYQESSLHPGLINNPHICIVPLTQIPLFFRSKAIPFVVSAPLKVFWQTWTLLLALSYRTKPSRWVLVQNPPSIPTLLVAYFSCLLRRTYLIIDWHNYGWTILAGTKGKAHPLVIISKYYEALIGRWASTVNFTVSDAMARQLRNTPYKISSPVLTLHDRPSNIFQPMLKPEDKQAFLNRLPETSNHASNIIAGRTKLLVSSTSWTPDENFNLLLEAMCSYALCPKSLPHVLAIITGKGPEKQHYINRINLLCSESRLANISFLTAWLSAEDYATLLACADLGVCLHTSSSGVDLPMKIIDMFGAGLPVVAYSSYESWRELVKEGENGRGFKSSEELSAIIQELFAEESGKQLSNLRLGALKEGRRRWDDEWDSVAGRLLGFCA